MIDPCAIVEGEEAWLSDIESGGWWYSSLCPLTGLQMCCELCVRAQIEASALPATPRPGDKSVSQPISVEGLEAGGPQLVMIITANNAGTSAWKECL